MPRDRAKPRQRGQCHSQNPDPLPGDLRNYVTLDDFDLEIHFVNEDIVLSEASSTKEDFMHSIKVLAARWLTRG